MWTAIAVGASFFSILFTWAFFKTLKEARAAKKGPVIEGKVVGFREKTGRGTEGGGMTTTYAPLIQIRWKEHEYVIDNTTYYSSTKKQEEGDTIKVRLNEEAPKASYVAGFWGENGKWMGILVGTLICYGAAWWLWKYMV